MSTFSGCMNNLSIVTVVNALFLSAFGIYDSDD